MERDDLPGPQPEVAKHPSKVDTPTIPSFELPVVEPGYRSARELRVRGKPLLGTEVKLRGYVTWVYDCAEAVAAANPRVSRTEVDAALQRDATLCERPMFSLGDARDASRDASITVVAPAAAASSTLAIGDYVAATGVWRTEASHPEGALTYGALERATSAPAAASEAPATPKEMEIDIDQRAEAPMRKYVDDQTLNASVEHLNLCNRNIVSRQYDTAITECQAATKAWVDNHLAWYALASAHLARRDWPAAKAAIEHAVTLRPDQPMYQLYSGIAAYEAEQARARDELARRAHKKPDEVELDPSMLKLDAARDALSNALRTSPELWRAHYYLGRIYRDLDDARHAAVQFTATIKTHPAYRAAYVALIELYRRWDYIDQALAVALLGTANVSAAEAGDLWFEAGVMYDLKRADDKALEAYSKAIAARADDANARFQRGQIYLRKGDLANAKRDLEEVARSADPRIAPARQLATQFLAQIATTKAVAGSRRAPFWDCRRGASGSMIVCRPR
jgi:lipopolysaccharide biosynthesis regulator YciM